MFEAGRRVISQESVLRCRFNGGELKRHSDGRGEVRSPAQLTASKNALLRMRVELESGQVSLSEGGVGSVIADSRPFGNRLSKMIAQAEQDYRRAGQG